MREPGLSGLDESRNDPAWPPPGAPGVEVLHPQLTLGAGLLFLIPWAFPIGLITFCSLIPGMLLGEAIAGDSPLVVPLMLLFTAGVGGSLCWLVLAMRRRVYRATTVLISPTGVQVRDHRGSQVRLRWADITSISLLKGVAAPTLLARVAHAATYELAALGQPIHPSAGLIGWGSRELVNRIPRRERDLLDQQRYDPRTGHHEIVIPFSVVGPVTMHNRLVVNVRHYRPDLAGGTG